MGCSTDSQSQYRIPSLEQDRKDCCALAYLKPNQLITIFRHHVKRINLEVKDSTKKYDSTLKSQDTIFSLVERLQFEIIGHQSFGQICLSRSEVAQQSNGYSVTLL
jgi:hypothetical protein